MGSKEGKRAGTSVGEKGTKRKRTADGNTSKRQAAEDTSEDIKKRKACTHKVSVPPSFDVSSITLDPIIYGTLDNPKYGGEYRKKYAFTLDPFQAISVACLEREESVMVAAHTSAGKTVVAEYAIAKALGNNQRVIYTSPLKALSNQKYRELKEEFGDVGIMTGDVTIDSDAGCVVMTTEILRSMLYRGSEMMREIAWVIFDEVHYMQDRERGVVWEETIINLPRACRMAFLSATLSNAQEFADWVASLHRQPCHVVFTDYRPTPLEHFALPCIAPTAEEKTAKAKKSAGLYRVCTKDGAFSKTMWEDLQAAGVIQTAEEAAAKQNGSAGKEQGSNGDGDANSDKNITKKKRDVGHIADRVVDVLRLAHERKLLPTIVFSFARKECEVFAMSCWNQGEKDGGLDFTDDDEKAAIEHIFDNAIDNLAEEDRDLLAIKNIKRYLMKGIGVHHGGLIPLLKEVVEILFQESLVKVLFATETFAMGLNMPARAVVFTSLTKFDGQASRYLSSGEYIQMSGRAGRRGKDDRGYCIMMVEDPDSFTPDVAQRMVSGAPVPLLSKFKLSYYTLLNLTKRSEGGLDHMEYLIKHSFQQFQHEQSMPAWQARITQLEEQLRSPEAEGLTKDACEEYVALRKQLFKCEEVVQAAMTQPNVCVSFLKAGRVVRVREGSTDWGWGIVVQATCRTPEPEGLSKALDDAAKEQAKSDRACWQVVVLLPTNSASKERGMPEPEATDSPAAELIPIPVPLALIVGISKDRLSLPTDVRSAATRKTVLANLDGFVNAKYGGPQHVAELHPVDDMNIKAPAVKQALKDMIEHRKALAGNLIFQKEMGSRKDQEVFEKFRQLAVERDQLKEKVAMSELHNFRSEVEHRMRVLRRLNHVTNDSVLTIKGKAAAEVDTADELMAVELMFNAVFKKLDCHQVVALLSCLVPCNEKDAQSDGSTRLPVELGEAISTLQTCAEAIAEISNECGLPIDKEEYVLKFTPNLMVPLYRWSKGATFKEVTEDSVIYEGTLIRCTRRLMELMNQLIYAAEKVGETEMQEQLQQALNSLQRGVMYAVSLYL